MKKVLIVMLSFAFMTTSAEAQFFKKLKEKVAQKVEKKVTDNISDKAASTADKQLEKMWETNLEGASFSFGAERVPAENIPATYSFDWEYTMTMATDQGDMDMTYLLTDDEPYIGMKMAQAKGMTIVFDTENQMTVMYMNSGNNNMVSATKITTDAEMEANNDMSYEDMEVREIGSKNILGYESQGYEMENDRYLVTFYVTDEAEANFTQMYQSNQKNLPEGFNPEWLKKGNGLMMEMEMTDKTDPDKTMKMTCTKLEKKPFALNTSDYQAF